MEPDSATDPYAAAYFPWALYQARELERAPRLETLAEYEVVRTVSGPRTTIHIVRTANGELAVLKGFQPGAAVDPLQLATLQDEALRMIRHRYGASLPLDGIVHMNEAARLGTLPTGPVAFLRMRYCQGGSLRDRIAAGALSPAEVAYHGLAVAAALEKLHGHALVHGDVKPENILFGHAVEDVPGSSTPRWRTWLADLETVVPVGGSTDWRMTKAYAAPEQAAGDPAAPAMDIWAWAITIWEALRAADPEQHAWRWLHDLLDRALSPTPAHRPTSEEIVAVYGRNIGFAYADGSRLGAGTSAAAVYPGDSAPAIFDLWESSGVHLVRTKLGWVAWLREFASLYELQTEEAFSRIDELSTRVLGDPADPASVWQALRDDPSASTVLPPPEARIRITLANGRSVDPGDGIPMPRSAALTFAARQTNALTELLERTGEPAIAQRLYAVAEAWERLDEFAAAEHTTDLALAWLSLDDPERASPLLFGVEGTDVSQPSFLAAVRLYCLITGQRSEAAKLVLDYGPSGPDWISMVLRDLMEAREYTLMADVLEALERDKAETARQGDRVPTVDMHELLRCAFTGRVTPVQPDTQWQALRDFCLRSIGPTTSIHKLAYFAEAALQRGEDGLARRLAGAARSRATLRMPVNHEERAAIEALALGRHPIDRGLTARLNHRAELWARDGKPDDPLAGLDVITGHRWVLTNSSVSADAVELVERSLQSRSTTLDRLLDRDRRCLACNKLSTVAELYVCGHCHRTYCPACTPGAECPCAGDITAPVRTRW